MDAFVRQNSRPHPVRGADFGLGSRAALREACSPKRKSAPQKEAFDLETSRSVCSYQVVRVAFACRSELTFSQTDCRFN